MTGTDAALYRAVCTAMRLDPDGEPAARMMRAAYSSQPRAPAGANVCYRYAVIQPDGAGVYPQKSGTGQDTRESVSVPYVLRLIFYGPDAEAYALRARAGILRDDGAYSPRAILRQAGIVPLPDPPLPMTLYEEVENEWRRRVDLELPFRLIVRDSAEETPVTAAPRVTLYNENGEQGEISCE